MGFKISNIQVRKTYTTRPPRIYPQFITDNEYQPIKLTIEYFQSLEGRKTPLTSVSRDLEDIIGSEKLAQNFTTLFWTFFYKLQTRDFSAVIPKIKYDMLLHKGVATPERLRMHVFNYINGNHNGFLKGDQREPVLTEIANKLTLTYQELVTLLFLDEEQNKIIDLVNNPTRQMIQELYNFQVVDTLFRHSLKVEFIIMEKLTGTLIKSLCFLCKRHGILYDIFYDQKGLLKIIFYGPYDIFGILTKYGRHLSNVTLNFIWFLMKNKKRWSMEAEVVLHDRKYLFHLKHTQIPPLAFYQGYKDILKETSPQYDSTVEERFADRFKGNSRGWSLVKEPEPLLVDDVVFIPDFAAKRGTSTVFIEVVGYWRPEYKERKKQKLHVIKQQFHNVILLVDRKFSSDFIESDIGFPIVYYSRLTRFNLTNLLNILDKFTDFDLRIRTLKASRRKIVREIQLMMKNQDFVDEKTLMNKLICFSQEELGRVFKTLNFSQAGLSYIIGIGALPKNKLDIIQEEIDKQVGNETIPLDDVSRAVKKIVAGINITPLIEHYNRYRINWTSLETPTIERVN